MTSLTLCRRRVFSIVLLLLLLHQPSTAANSNNNNGGNAWKLPKGVTAVVTGGTKGIGRAIVDELVRQHECRVLTCSRSQADLDELLKCHSKSKLLQGVVADVATAQGRETFVAAIHEFRSSRHAIGQAAALLTTQTLPITTNELDVVVSLLVGSDAVPLARGCLEYLWAPKTDY
jgi:hypothetical protein